MPLQADGSDFVEVKRDKTFSITNIIIHVKSTRIDVIYEAGNVDGEVFTATKTDSLSLSGNEFYAVALALPDPDKNFYENLKATLYPYVMTKEGVTGTIT